MMIATQANRDQPLQGHLDDIDDSLGSAPYSNEGERKVLIQQYDYAVRTLMDMVVEGDLVLDPDYQRQYRWSDEKAARFIESIVLNIPVPVLYFAEDSDGTFSVIDGQQRLTSLLRFIKPNELSSLYPDRQLEPLELRDLRVRPDLNGRSFMSLPRLDKSALAKRPIRCIVILNESDTTLKFEVFERLNTGSVSLTDQEVRNCIYRGSYNQLIKRLAANEDFHELINLSEGLSKAMKDAELVLRFFAYRELSNETEYADNFAEYLNKHLEDRRVVGEDMARRLQDEFTATVQVIKRVLGPGIAFRKPSNREDPSSGTFAQNKINGAIYEAQMISFSRYLATGRTLSDIELKERTLRAFSNDIFWNSLFQGTAQRRKAIDRSRILTDLLVS
jgi:hypothetical protein